MLSNEKVQAALELLVDKVGYRRVAENLVELGYAKAEHIETHWQDKGLAGVWRRAARKLGRAVHFQIGLWPG